MLRSFLSHTSRGEVLMELWIFASVIRNLLQIFGVMTCTIFDRALALF